MTADDLLRVPQRIRAISLDRPDDRQPPIDHTAASRVAKATRLRRIDSCCRGALSSNDADTRSPAGPGEPLPTHDSRTESDTDPRAPKGRFSLRRSPFCPEV